MKLGVLLGLLALGSAGCTVQPLPPVVPPDDGPGTCETARETAVQLGGCGVELGSFLERCENRVRAYAQADAVYPLGCLTASRSCDEFRACR